MIALSAATVVEDRLATVFFANGEEAFGHFSDRGFPLDLLKCSVGASSKRLG